MTQVKMPESVAYPSDDWVEEFFGKPDECGFYVFRGDFGNIADRFRIAAKFAGLITTTQAEAYAEARVREAQQWISVETLLPPDDGKEVLAIHSDGEVEIVYGHLILETHFDRVYTHWMPMPEQPTVE